MDSKNMLKCLEGCLLLKSWEAVVCTHVKRVLYFTRTSPLHLWDAKFALEPLAVDVLNLLWWHASFDLDINVSILFVIFILLNVFGMGEGNNIYIPNLVVPRDALSITCMRICECKKWVLIWTLMYCIYICYTNYNL